MCIKDHPPLIALLGQPNAGKSTLFNKLTGMNQHVGNWPGKTIEKKTGRFQQGDKTLDIVDLPGTYSLSPNSQEEIITRDFVLSGKAGVIVMVLDASQFERSLYLLADYMGLDTPVIIALNMVDVALKKGRRIDHKKIGRRLGIPVVPLVAVKGKGISQLLTEVDTCLKGGDGPDHHHFFKAFEQAPGLHFSRLRKLVAPVQCNTCTRDWIIDKLLARDAFATDLVRQQVPEGKWDSILALLDDNDAEAVRLKLGRLKYQWIEEQTRYSGTPSQAAVSGFDALALHPAAGKILALFFIMLGLAASLVLVSPLFMLTARVPMVSALAADVLAGMDVPDMIISMVASALIPSACLALVLILCVVGFVFVIGLMEDVGYLARIAFVFNNGMNRFGLHGKSVMPLLMGLTCSIAGVTASRVIDSWKQRSLTIIVSLVVPCLAVWSVISLMSGLFFGPFAVLIVAALLVTCAGHMLITAKVFTHILNIDRSEPGLVMELPPYHRPNFKTIFARVFRTAKGVFKKSFGVIISVSLILWALSYSGGGDIRDSLLYTLGKWIEPVGLFFGMDWRLFLAFIISGMGKEAALGVIAMLFGTGGPGQSLAGVMVGAENLSINTSGLSQALMGAGGITAAKALAFIFAYFLNIPCIAALAVVYSETKSSRLTLLTTVYYLGVALVTGGIVYRLALYFL